MAAMAAGDTLKNEESKEFVPSALESSLLQASLQLIGAKSEHLNTLESEVLPILDEVMASQRIQEAAKAKLAEVKKICIEAFSKGVVHLPGNSRYDVNCCGWLEKLGKGGLQWQHRWVELCGQQLSYFDRSRGETRGRLDIESCIARKVDDMQFELTTKVGKGKVKKKEGVAYAKSSYRFRTSTKDECDFWVDSLNIAIENSDIERCKAVRAKFRAAQDNADDPMALEAAPTNKIRQIVRSYLRNLCEISGQTIRVPVDFLHQQLEQKRSDERDTRGQGRLIAGIQRF